MTRHEYNRRQRRTSSWIRKEKRLAIYIRDDFRCCYCGQNLKSAHPRQVTLDHLEPRCNGDWDNDATNLVTACLSCNSARQNQPWAAFAGPRRFHIQGQRRLTLNIELAKDIILRRKS